MVSPTPYPEINDLLQLLQSQVQTVLGDQFLGMYLEGSLATGDFDQDSDVDFVVVTTGEISSELFAALQAMHDRIAASDSPWAIQLEGSYIPRQAIRNFDPQHTLYPNLERGRGERLKWVHHSETWANHRAILRERGLTLAGPPPQTLIDPVSPEELRGAVRSLLQGWAARILDHPETIGRAGYQSYVVLSLCRILYTFQSGEVVSKPVAARWAQAALNAKWPPLIERAWIGRHDPDRPAQMEDVQETLDFIHFARQLLGTP